ncbi:MAG: PaaI family thioesterase [Burkholderiaceae bacterium]
MTILSVDADAGTAVLEFTCRPEFCHSGGKVAQGGYVTAWMDAAMAHAVMLCSGQKQSIASLDISVRFLERVGPGKVRSQGRIVRKGRRVAFLEASLHDTQGRLLATATSSGLLIEFSSEG